MSTNGAELVLRLGLELRTRGSNPLRLHRTCYLSGMAKKMPEKQKPGPKAETVAVDGDWKDALRKAISVERPEEGWPDPPKKPQGRPKKKQPEPSSD